MSDNFSSHVETVFRNAEGLARRANLPFVATAHLLVGLLQTRAGNAYASLLRSMDEFDWDQVYHALETTLPRIEPEGEAGSEKGMPFSPGALKAVTGAGRIAQAFSGQAGQLARVDGDHLLLALLYSTDERSSARAVLEKLGLKRAQVALRVWIGLGREIPATDKLPGGFSLSDDYKRANYVHFEMMKIVKREWFVPLAEYGRADRDGDVVDPKGCVNLTAKKMTFDGQKLVAAVEVDSYAKICAANPAIKEQQERHTKAVERFKAAQKEYDEARFALRAEVADKCAYGDLVMAASVGFQPVPPGGELSDEERKRLVRQFEDTFNGPRGADGIFVAPAGCEIVKAGPPPELLRHAAQQIREMANLLEGDALRQARATSLGLPKERREEFLKTSRAAVARQRERRYLLADQLDGSSKTPPALSWLNERCGCGFGLPEAAQRVEDVCTERNCWQSWLSHEFGSLEKQTDLMRWSMDRPNAMQSWNELFDEAGRQLLITGVAYFWEVCNAQGELIEVHALPSRDVYWETDEFNEAVIRYRVDLGVLDRLNPTKAEGLEMEPRVDERNRAGTFAVIPVEQIKDVRLPADYWQKRKPVGESPVKAVRASFDVWYACEQAQRDYHGHLAEDTKRLAKGLNDYLAKDYSGITVSFDDAKPDAVVEENKGEVKLPTDKKAALIKVPNELIKYAMPATEFCKKLDAAKTLDEILGLNLTDPPTPDEALAAGDDADHDFKADPPTAEEVNAMHQAVTFTPSDGARDDSEALQNVINEVAANEECPRGHHKLEGSCRREFCSCRCGRCERQCGQAKI